MMELSDKTLSDEMVENQTPSSEAQASDKKSELPFIASAERLSDIERKMTVEILWPHVKNSLDDAYRELQHSVAIKGFRKGKVPRKMLEQLFGKHVVKEVAQRMVQNSLSQALRDNNLAPVSEPHVVDEGIRENETFRYSAVMEIVPEIDPHDYFGVEVTIRSAAVSDTDIDLALQKKQRELTDYRTIEGRKTIAGDVLLVDIIGKVGNAPFSRENALIELDSPPLEPLPGLAAALTGIPCDQEEVDVELDVPDQTLPAEDIPSLGGATQKARLLITIKDVKQKVVPELDDEFARDTGEAETLAQLRDVLRQKLLLADEKRAQEEAKATLIKEIVKRNNVPVVPALVARHLDQTVKFKLALWGLDSKDQPVEEEMLKERLREESAETVKESLLLKAIAKKENVEVQDVDIEQKLAEIASATSQNMSRVRSEYEKEGQMAGLRLRIQEDKTLDLLLSKANIIREKSAIEAAGAEIAVQPDSKAEPSLQEEG